MAFLLLVIVAEVAIAYVVGMLVGMERVGSQSTQLLQVSLQLVAAVVATAIMLRSIDVRPWSDVGMDRRAARPRVLLEAWLLGGMAIALACGALLALGWLRIVPGPEGSSMSAAFSLTAFLIVAALGEELISRGYLLTTLRDGLGAKTAVGVTSVLFGAAHLRNAGVTVQSFCIVTLAGVFLGAIRLALRSVYASSAAHVAWNWVLAVAFHASVSGIRFDAPDYRTVEQGPDWLTGGQWGPEGGLAAALGMLGVLAYLHRTRPRRREES
ncbi:MAG TPA: CPBP family intramembrane glutamic endopeptidase [Gemmatimonadaceae bacterium]|nr:CPBP family intramembrane glutamic endopeptidase [Gemmatimonadaceae bacterium]